MKPIPYGRQHITEADVQAVVAALTSEYMTQGPRVAEFENAFAAYVGAKYAVAVANGTAALHLCALALDVQPGQKVITSPITFAASANCVRYAGGEVVFADIDAATYCIDPAQVEALLQAAPKGTYAGIIPVDFAGHPAQLATLRQLADAHGCWLIEDACHAPGAWLRTANGVEHRCGDGSLAELAIFSFHPVKHIATGEGGMITTNDERLCKRLQLLRTHGISKDPAQLHENHGGWYYEMQELGFNYRIPDVLCALGTSQLARADEGLARRQQLAAQYDVAFEGSNVQTPKVQTGAQHAYHLYVIQTDDRKGLYDHLRSKGIYAQVHYIPVHWQPYYQNLGYQKGSMPVAEAYYARCLSLPMYPTLTDAEQQYVVDSVLGFVRK